MKQRRARAKSCASQRRAGSIALTIPFGIDVAARSALPKALLLHYPNAYNQPSPQRDLEGPGRGLVSVYKNLEAREGDP
jgi:hypothetical protein